VSLEEKAQKLYEFDMAIHQMDVEKTERQNKMAEREKAQRQAQVWIDYASALVSAWASSATPATFWFGAMYSALMLPVVATQSAAIASENVRQDAPPAPKAPKFRQGGIVGNHGSKGMEAIVGDGVSEVILPLEKKTYDALGESISEAMQLEEARKLEEYYKKIDEIQARNGTLKDIEMELIRQETKRQAERHAYEEAKLSLLYNQEQNFIINQTNHMPYTSNASIVDDGEEKTWERIALKVCNQIKDGLDVGIAFDRALMSRSRGVLNAVRDQGL
jgi:hypothetical protein